MPRYEYPNKKIAVADLRVGDVLQQLEGPFGTAIVKQVTDGEVKLFRPYGANAGFVHIGNATICYTGLEETIFFRSGNEGKHEFLVYQRENFDAK